MKVKIYLGNLSLYMSGHECGEWIALPMPKEKLVSEYERIVAKGKDDYEHIILDTDAVFEIGEYDNVFELNEMILELEEMGIDNTVLNVISKITDSNAELFQVLESGRYIIIDVDSVAAGWKIDGKEKYGRVLHELGYNTVFKDKPSDDLIDYIDWESVYETLEINDGWEFVKVKNAEYIARIY